MRRILIICAFMMVILLPSNTLPASNQNRMLTSASENSLDDYFTHVVFCEFGSNTDSPLDPTVSEMLFNLYSSREYPFYYVSMVGNRENKALERLENEYNITSYPTLFFDGGYSVLYDTQIDEVSCINYITTAGVRDAPDITLTLSADWFQDCCNKKVITNVNIRNNGDNQYNGHIRVYLTEIKSRWYNNEGNPYHFGFLAYTIDREISVSPKNNLSITTGVDVTTIGYPDATPDNLMIIGVLFNSEVHQGFSDSPHDTHPFDAYYVDAVDADKVKGDLETWVKFNRPRTGFIYLFGLPIKRIFFDTPLLIGKTTVEAEVNRFLQTEKVEFYMDDKLRNTDTQPPYTWVWSDTLIGRHTIKAKAYHSGGITSKTTQEVIAFIF